MRCFSFFYTMQTNQPIGIFDSGVGGLTIAKAISEVLPHENIIYFGDTAHLPYGEKSAEAIIGYSIGIAEFLLSKGAKCIVMACNSASAVAYNTLVERFPDTPIYNVIDPVAEWVGDKGYSLVSIIGTRATIGSNIYAEKITKHSPTALVKSKATPLLVPIIEEGLAQSSIAKETIDHYLKADDVNPMQALILGCTHYPLMKNQIKKSLSADTEIIDSPKLVANRVHSELSEKEMLNPSHESGKSEFYISDYTLTFERIAQYFFGTSISLSEKNIW